MESKTKWFRVGRWALYVGPAKVPGSVMSTRACYLRKFWRIFRVYPGVSAPEILKAGTWNELRKVAFNR